MINQVKHIEGLIDANLPLDDFVVINSVWLSLMGLRKNGDLDLLISSKLWNDRFSDKPKDSSFGIPGPYEGRLRVHSIECGPYGKLNGVIDNDDIVYNRSIVLEGIPLVEPALYFRYKVERFLLLEKRLSNLPRWRKNRFLAGDHRNIIRKWKKDYNDFRILKTYFGKEKHLSDYFSEVTSKQWGLEDKFLLPYIT